MICEIEVTWKVKQKFCVQVDGTAGAALEFASAYCESLRPIAIEATTENSKLEAVAIVDVLDA